MFLCAGCKEPIENPSSVGQKYCKECKRIRDYESKVYHKYLCRMMREMVI